LGNVLSLVPHPSVSAPPIVIAAGLRKLDNELWAFRYEVTGEHSSIILPRPGPKSPTWRDGLWETTCFEAFGRRKGANAYREFNFSPSGDWAAYAFTSYREGMSAARMRRALVVAVMPTDSMLAVEGLFSPSDLDQAEEFNLTAVIEDRCGTKSYWALRHPPGDKPDFHHPDCFVLELPSQQLSPSPRT
jgi:hypothetical protein